jgi:putative ABC transport system permease protein
VRKPFTRDFAAQLLGVAATDAAAAIEAAQSSATADTQSTVLKVVGVTKKSATSFMIGTSPILVSTEDARLMYEFTTKGTPDYEKFLYAYARIKDGTNQSNIESAQKQLSQDGYYSQSVKDIQKSLLQIVNTLQIVVMVFGLITLIASVFGIVNTQYISVLERTREIGLMKALGMRAKISVDYLLLKLSGLDSWVV